MPKTFIVSWHMDGSFEMNAESEEEVREFMKTMNRQELVFKCRFFDFDVEEVDKSESGEAR